MAPTKSSAIKKTPPETAAVKNASVSKPKPKRKSTSRPPAARTEGFNAVGSHTNQAALGFWYGCPDHPTYLTMDRLELTRHLHGLEKHPEQARSVPKDEELDEYIVNIAEAYQKLGREKIEKKVKVAMNRIAKHQGWDDKAGKITAKATSEASDASGEEGNEGEEQSADGQQAEEVCTQTVR